MGAHIDKANIVSGFDIVAAGGGGPRRRDCVVGAVVRCHGRSNRVYTAFADLGGLRAVVDSQLAELQPSLCAPGHFICCVANWGTFLFDSAV